MHTNGNGYMPTRSEVNPLAGKGLPPVGLQKVTLPLVLCHASHRAVGALRIRPNLVTSVPLFTWRVNFLLHSVLSYEKSTALS